MVKYDSAPTDADWTAAKRVLRYLKCTKDAHLEYSSDKDLIGYSDSDWAEDMNTRRSTTGYVFLYIIGSKTFWASDPPSSNALTRQPLRNHFLSSMNTNPENLC